MWPSMFLPVRSPFQGEFVCFFGWKIFHPVACPMFVLVCLRFFTKKYSILIFKGKTFSNNGILLIFKGIFFQTMVFFGVVKCSLENEYFVALLDVCSRSGMIGTICNFFWKHLTLPQIQLVAPPIVTQHLSSRVLILSGC